MPIVRSPWTLECPRTGNRPAPGLPMLPWAKARLQTSLMVATELRCWVRPIAQQNTVAVESRSSCAGFGDLLAAQPGRLGDQVPVELADVRLPALEPGACTRSMKS